MTALGLDVADLDRWRGRRPDRLLDLGACLDGSAAAAMVDSGVEVTVAGGGADPVPGAVGSGPQEKGPDVRDLPMNWYDVVVVGPDCPLELVTSTDEVMDLVAALGLLVLVGEDRPFDSSWPVVHRRSGSAAGEPYKVLRKPE
ncbi:hypothetical protein [Cellulomonas carbonis]|uniref:hypothetical protein n=1 Tax=Cellulomonas carbonis TaxID=1386092 RepID=UPI00166BF0ED|nr:hypothetical protein [Cellulomonas carbonis]GGC17834.1 hypothetical protein GCM10010972_33830 [Cellulomonas carbonis]